VSERDLKEARLGFRARYVVEFARRVVGGDLDLDDWCREQDANALREAVLGMKGVGSYGASHLLMLLGHYGEKEVERLAAKRYEQWGRYAYLAYKFERVSVKTMDLKAHGWRRTLKKIRPVSLIYTHSQSRNHR
jgi:hypothetical protein